MYIQRRTIDEWNSSNCYHMSMNSVNIYNCKY